MSTSTPITKGFDCAHYQGVINWAKVKAAGYQYAYAKATEDVNIVDPMFAANRIGARANGVIFGPYHFGRGGSVSQEAAHFAAVVGALQPGEFAVLDAEVPGTTPAWSRSWLDLVTGFWSTRPFLYTYEAMRAHYDWTPVSSANYGLIAAKYDGTQTPTNPAPWSVEAMRQYASDGAIPGIIGKVDLDDFFGDVPTLQKYCKQGAPTPVPTPIPAPQPVPPAPSFDVRTWTASYGHTDPHLPSLQAWANRMFPAYRSTPIGPLSSNYGPQTRAFIIEFMGHFGVKVTGMVIGPQVTAHLYRLGWRG